MVVRRRKGFNTQIDPALLQSFEASAANDPQYDYELFSGYRPNPSRRFSQHGPEAQGEAPGAIDFNMIDRKTGQALANYGDPNTATTYQAAANRWYQSLSPEQQALARWGGYFNEGGKDWMHVDFGGADRMGAGDWKGGFNQARQKELGLSSGGGVGEAVAQMQQAGYTTEQILGALASIESAGEKDPYAAVGAEADPAGHRARGKYQVMDYNIEPWAEQYLNRKGVTVDQFMADPKLQDELAGAVMTDYRKQYGDRGAFSKWYTGSEKEPARTDVHGKLTGKTYTDTAMEYLGRTAGTPQATAATNYNSPSEGATHFGGTGLGTPTEKTAFKPFDYKAFGKKFTEGLGDFGGAATGPAGTGITDLPRAVLASGTPTTYGPPGGQEDPRQKLALALQKLNAGKLVI